MSSEPRSVETGRQRAEAETQRQVELIERFYRRRGLYVRVRVERHGGGWFIKSDLGQIFGVALATIKGEVGQAIARGP